MSKTVLFQIIQFSISAQFSSIWPIDRCYHSGPKRTWERWQLRGNPQSPKLQHYWNPTNWLFGVLSRTPVGGSLTPLQRSGRCILLPQSTGQGVTSPCQEKMALPAYCSEAVVPEFWSGVLVPVRALFMNQIDLSKFICFWTTWHILSCKLLNYKKKVYI